MASTDLAVELGALRARLERRLDTLDPQDSARGSTGGSSEASLGTLPAPRYDEVCSSWRIMDQVQARMDVLVNEINSWQKQVGTALSTDLQLHALRLEVLEGSIGVPQPEKTNSRAQGSPRKSQSVEIPVEHQAAADDKLEGSSRSSLDARVTLGLLKLMKQLEAGMNSLRARCDERCAETEQDCKKLRSDLDAVRADPQRSPAKSADTPAAGDADGGTPWALSEAIRREVETVTRQAIGSIAEAMQGPIVEACHTRMQALELDLASLKNDVRGFWAQIPAKQNVVSEPAPSACEESLMSLDPADVSHTVSKELQQMLQDCAQSIADYCTTEESATKDGTTTVQASPTKVLRCAEGAKHGRAALQTPNSSSRILMSTTPRTKQHISRQSAQAGVPIAQPVSGGASPVGGPSPPQPKQTSPPAWYSVGMPKSPLVLSRQIREEHSPTSRSFSSRPLCSTAAADARREVPKRVLSQHVPPSQRPTSFLPPKVTTLQRCLSPSSAILPTTKGDAMAWTSVLGGKCRPGIKPCVEGSPVPGGASVTFTREPIVRQFAPSPERSRYTCGGPGSPRRPSHER